MARRDAPDIVVGRLPIYLRALEKMRQAGHEITSSAELGTQLGISSAQIRKDLSHFGEFGKQGTGYNIASLSRELRRILHVDCEWKVAVVGIGNLGRAIANYGGFSNRAFVISLLFDNDPVIVGTIVGGLEVLPVTQMVDAIRREGILVAMITVPADEAQHVADRLVEAGVKAMLNYAPISLNVPIDVHIQDIDPVLHLHHMTYYLKE
jgi:redox-sensing transcriptional repressor